MKHVQLNKNSQAGFSLVELMVVVAIIGILASLAIPSIGKYMAKARQSEAKTQLSSLYTAEKAFYAEYTAYHTSFSAIGYSPEGQLRYNVGFSAAGNDAGIGNGYNVTLSAAQLGYINANAYCAAPSAAAPANGCKMMFGANNAAVPALTAGSIAANSASFVAQAACSVFNTTVDRWQITSDKVISNPSPGIL